MTSMMYLKRIRVIGVKFYILEKLVDELNRYCNNSVPITATAIPEMKTRDTRRLAISVIASSVASFRLTFTSEVFVQCII